ncbi:MAG: hypothetical protein WKG01_18475 [Kofleriaceae bacterium]
MQRADVTVELRPQIREPVVARGDRRAPAGTERAFEHAPELAEDVWHRGGACREQLEAQVTEPDRGESLLDDLECRDLVRDEQHRLAESHRVDDQVGDCLRLASAWRALEHEARACTCGGDRAQLVMIGIERREQIGRRVGARDRLGRGRRWLGEPGGCGRELANELEAWLLRSVERLELLELLELSPHRERDICEHPEPDAALDAPARTGQRDALGGGDQRLEIERLMLDRKQELEVALQLLGEHRIAMRHLCLDRDQPRRAGLELDRPQRDRRIVRDAIAVDPHERAECEP